MKVLWGARVHLPRSSVGPERCGVFVGLNLPGLLVIERSVEVPNRHEDPGTYFAMSRADVADATAHLAHPVIAHWHTHDDPWPASDADVAGCGDILGAALHPETGYSSWFTREGLLEVSTALPLPGLAPAA